MSFSIKLLSHFIHINDFSPVWVLSRFFKTLAYEKLFSHFVSHFVQLNGFSPVCILLWVRTVCSLVPFWEHHKQALHTKHKSIGHRGASNERAIYQVINHGIRRMDFMLLKRNSAILFHPEHLILTLSMLEVLSLSKEGFRKSSNLHFGRCIIYRKFQQFELMVLYEERSVLYRVIQ